MRLRLVRARDSFHLISTSTDLKVKINEATLLVRRMKINPSVSFAHNKALEVSTAKYPITRAECKSITIGSGV